jgi:hypothetical protein
MSWANRRVQFKEKKPLISLVDLPSVDLPSKFIFSKNSNHVEAVICAIALNEERYIDEWIKYNILLGFTHIYIYDNSHNNILKNKESDKVTIIHFPGITKQLEAYDSFVLQYKNKHTWAAFIDCDEFIVLKKHDNVMSFINQYNNCGAIALNWLMFGTSNEKEYRDEPVIKRFTYCSKNIHNHIKCIAKLSYINNYENPHRPVLLKSVIFDTNRNLVPDSLNPDGDDKIACIHHYYTKSEHEFREKLERGRADIVEKRSLDELHDIHSKNNDIYNSDAWEFYSKNIYVSNSYSS